MDRLTLGISELYFDPSNVRKHDAKNLEAITASLKRFGQQKPIVIDSNNIVRAGNGTLSAAKALGWDTIECVVSDLSSEELVAYAIADNRTGELAEWDDDALAKQLMSMDEDLRNIAYDDYPLPEDEALPSEDDDVVPETSDNERGVKLGDLWMLGEHRLLCGDSTDEATVGKLMDGEKADMVFTDPPYNVASDSKNFAGEKKGGWFGNAMSDLKESQWDKDFKIEPALDRLVDSVSDNCTMYIWTSQFLINDIWTHLKDFGYIAYLVWSKTNPMPSMSKRHPSWNTELCVYASRGGKRVVNFPKKGHFLSCREVAKKSDGSHPTQKPLELIEPLVTFSSNPNQTVLDLFLGSGSTLIACEKTNRKCYGMELDPHYCSVIIKRWEEFSGKEAHKAD